MPEIPQRDEEVTVKKDDPEAQKPEDAKNPEKRDERPKLSPEEQEKADKERAEKEEQKKNRDAEEGKEHTTDEDAAEKKLDDAIYKQKYESMKGGLEGDARELFTAVEGQLTEQEKIDLTKDIDGFNETWDREWAKATGDAGGQTQAEKMKEATGRRDQNNSITLQNSLDEIIRETQGIARDNPKTNVGKLAKEVNEKVNASLGKRETTEGDKAVRKLYDAVQKHIVDEQAKDPNKTFKPKEKQRKYVVDEKSDDEYKEKADTYAAQNLLNEVPEAKERGIVITIKDAEGNDLTTAEEISTKLMVVVGIKTEGAAAKLTPEQIQKGMVPGTMFLEESGGIHSFMGATTNLREGVENLEKVVDKNIKKLKLKA